MTDPRHRERQPITPLQARVGALVADGLGRPVPVHSADRSPVGPRALRLALAAPGAPPSHALAEWAERQAWIDAVAARPENVYIRPAVAALEEWLQVDLADPAAACAAGRRDRVTVVCPAAPEMDSLTAFRLARCADSLAALLRLCGGGLVVHDGTDAPLRTLVVREHDGRRRELPVGNVDVRHGALRARHGGLVALDDVLADMDAHEPPSAHARLAFTLLRTPRARRVTLDDTRLARSTHELATLVGACRPPSGAPEAAGTRRPESIRALVLELDRLPSVVARAADAFDPAVVLRYAELLGGLIRELEPAAALDPVARSALRLALEAAGISQDDLDRKAGDLHDAVLL